MEEKRRVEEKRKADISHPFCSQEKKTQRKKRERQRKRQGNSLFPPSSSLRLLFLLTPLTSWWWSSLWSQRRSRRWRTSHKEERGPNLPQLTEKEGQQHLHRYHRHHLLIVSPWWLKKTALPWHHQTHSSRESCLPHLLLLFLRHPPLIVSVSIPASSSCFSCYWILLVSTPRGISGGHMMAFQVSQFLFFS